jgi:protein-L-isoaspartate(D-aspartate) O-methyltransferase
MMGSNDDELRDTLVNGLRTKGIYNEAILEAIRKIPRHLFITNESVDIYEAYEDKPLSIGQGQTISQPFTVAFQTQLLAIKKGEKVLEIGTGSGYQSAVLSEMGADVYTIERQEKLFSSTKEKLKELGYSDVHMYYGDGNFGIHEHAPYDKILITAAAPEIPNELLKQLKDGGIMVLPVDGHVQRMKRIIKKTQNEIEIQDHGAFHFVPMLPGIVMD